ncbi:Nitric oxide synthase [Orchesella cincta]|uniref:Nitric oxide synthase n=1 Tax=Orchesella cincta TaxID=48709 RepID=A0A1D2MR81_ORCCI|nr:Nitric oxide synthase [Orchesella cincta]
MSDSNRCTEHVCLGSIVSFPSTKSITITCRPVEEVRSLAKDFFDQYYTSIKRYNSTSHVQRWEQVQGEITDTGTYNLTETELVYGAKLAWRNSVRCIGRIQWAKLQVFDARSVTTTTGMFEAVCKHIKYATNKGNIRSAITIFPQRTDGKHDFRIWNPQLIGYAGYRQSDGTVIGDPISIEFTEVCTKLGWKGKGTKWDILPLVLSSDGHDPEYFEIPSELILEIPIVHPKYGFSFLFKTVIQYFYWYPMLTYAFFSFEWFAEMDIRWYALPAVSSMLFDCGGLEFTACPFNGWYMGTEIGCRDLGDVHRYNMLEEVAIRMGLDIKNPTTLWKDRAIVELNLAVLYSYQKAGVTVVDHHTASESFMKHYENEMRMRGGCPADWVWMRAPQCRALRHQYSTRKWHYTTSSQVTSIRILRGKSMSGKKGLVNEIVNRMEDYDIINIEHETLILVVTSTFGNGDPPENGESFAHSLYAIKMNQGLSMGADDLSMASSKSFIKMNSQTDSVAAERRFDRNDSLKGSQISDIMSDDNLGPLRNITFAVFALGSSAYPNFCAFGRYVDNLFGELGGERLMKLTCGDELAGQDQAFRSWASEIFQTACDSFCLDFDKNMADISAALKADTLSPESVRFLPVQAADDEVQGKRILCRLLLRYCHLLLKITCCILALSKLHNRKVNMYSLAEKVNLHEKDTSRVTIKVVLRKRLSSETPLSYQSGDHVGIMAENRVELVDKVLERLGNKPATDDEAVQLQLLQEKHTPMGVQKQWIPHERLPRSSLRGLFTRYLDITTPPRPNLFLYLMGCTEDTEEQERLSSLAKDSDVYEHWKQVYWPTLVTVLEQFPKVKPDATVLCTMLPLLQPRFYSVSSSPIAYNDELHLTVAVVTYKTKGGEGPTHYGVCSNYLNDIQIGTLVPCFVRSAVSFHLPTDTSRPMIMIGPGTGIAPFRGFWQERKILGNRKPGSRFGKMTLFFGCRTKEMILYRSELESLKKESILSDIFLALSREPSVKKTYVQDLLRREGDAVARQIMKEGGHVYVCGDCTMAEDVYQTLKSIVQERGMLNDAEVENYMLSLRDDNRYHEDIFGITHRTAEVHEKVRQTAMTRIESNYSLNNATASK